MCNLKDFWDGWKTLGKAVVFSYILSTWWNMEHLGTGYDSLKGAEDGLKISPGHRDLERKARRQQ